MDFLTKLRLKKLIKNFAVKSGLKYHSHIDAKDKEIKVVRGLTVSATHKDSNYCVGSISNYNISILTRTDDYHDSVKTKANNWLILAIDLHTAYRIPHFFVAAVGKDLKPYEDIFSSYPNMHAMAFPYQYTNEFLSRFNIYARPGKFSEVEKFFPVPNTQVMAAHFWPLMAEQHDNVLYIYAEPSQVKDGYLEIAIENGLWMAGQLDRLAAELTLENSI